MSPFAQRIDAFLAEYFALDPITATAAGNHDHDARWPDFSDAGHAAQLAFIDRWRVELGAADDGGLSLDERVDRDVLLLELDAQHFALTELREETWDPLSWVYLLGGGIFPLLAREFAPLHVPPRLDRGASRDGPRGASPRQAPARRERRPPCLALPCRDRAQAARGHRGARRRRRARSRRPRGRGRTSPRSCPTSGRPPKSPGRRSAGSKPTFATPSFRAQPARAGSGPTCSRRSCATRCGPNTRRGRRSSRRPSASTRPSGPR